MSKHMVTQRRLPYRICPVLALLILALVHRGQRYGWQFQNADFSSAIRNCVGFAQPVSLTNPVGSWKYPKGISEMLVEVDHVFVLAVQTCQLALPDKLAQRTTCISGKELDKCAPKRYIAGQFTHAMKVSFAHATILELAQTAQYRHVAIIEIDAVFSRDSFLPHSVDNFKRILSSNDWNIIRFGYRPYFLEESSRERCSRRCRCHIDTRYGHDFCKLWNSGCDMRSSDFYIIHQNSFGKLKGKIIDLRNQNSKRIIDTWPMRSISKQWMLIPHGTIQQRLDIPLDYQVGLQSLYMKKCVSPREISASLTSQLSRKLHNSTPTQVLRPA